MMHICSAPVQGFHIHNLLSKEIYVLWQKLLTCWNRADANLFWYTLCLCWKRQRIMICKSPFPYISGFYKPLSDLSSAISFQGWWVLSDFAASYTEAAPLTLLQIFPVYLIHSETCIFLKWDAPRLNKMAPAVFLSAPFPVWPFLTLHLLLWLLLSQNWAVHLRTCSVLKISFVISQNQPFIFSFAHCLSNNS